LNRNRHRRKKRGNPESSEAGFLSAVQLELLFMIGYQQDLAIMKRLAEQDKTNSGWQRDLIVSLY
jgi:hypothetical protein